MVIDMDTDQISPSIPLTWVEQRAGQPRRRGGPLGTLWWLVRQRSVQIAIAGWLLVNAVLLSLAGKHLPFFSPQLSEVPTAKQVLSTNVEYIEIFILMLIVHALTRRRPIPNIADRVPATSIAKRETALVLAYGVLGSAGGFFVGHAFGWHAFSFHLMGSIYGTTQMVVPAEVFCWAAYNLIVFAIIPFVVFRQRYTTEQLSLRSTNRRKDTTLIFVILIIESTVQLVFVSSAILRLQPLQILEGAPLTFIVMFAGTVLPTMIFIYCILAPRYLKLTGSVPATVILGGVTYASLHFFDGWTNFGTPADAALSICYLLLFYTGPGMFKTFITIRSANAWTHVWAYHAIAPHTLLDTPMMVKVFGIR
jgi:hypothetical protein